MIHAGSLESDAGRKIAKIEYDYNNNPVRIQFTNGIDKYQFEEGYCQASAAGSVDYFDSYYYDRDHLGNIRRVIIPDDNPYKSFVIQTMDYYPFGAEFCDGGTKSFVQNHKYNGKEFDHMHGLNTYDYGARQYNPVTGRWDRMDPHSESYYPHSPFNYCLNNPVRLIDPDGRDVKITVGNEPIGTTTINLYSAAELKSGNIKGPKTTTVPVYEVTISNDSGESNTYYYTRIGYRKDYKNQDKAATEVTFDVQKDGDTFAAVVKSRWGGKDNVLELRDPNNINNQTVEARKGSNPQNRTAVQFHVKGATDGCLLAVGKNQINSPTKEVRSDLPGTSKAAQSSFMSDVKKYQENDKKNGFSTNINATFRQIYEGQ